MHYMYGLEIGNQRSSRKLMSTAESKDQWSLAAGKGQRRKLGYQTLGLSHRDGVLTPVLGKAL